MQPLSLIWQHDSRTTAKTLESMKAFLFKPSNELIGKLQVEDVSEIPAAVATFLASQSSIPLYSYVEASGRAWTIVGLGPLDLREGRFVAGETGASVSPLPLPQRQGISRHGIALAGSIVGTGIIVLLASSSSGSGNPATAFKEGGQTGAVAGVALYILVRFILSFVRLGTDPKAIALTDAKRVARRKWTTTAALTGPVVLVAGYIMVASIRANTTLGASIGGFVALTALFMFCYALYRAFGVVSVESPPPQLPESQPPHQHFTRTFQGDADSSDAPRRRFLERCPHCGADVMFITSTCPNCQRVR